MPGEEKSPNDDGPKYKISSFLFGNVNKEGQIEEYQHDVELKSINNLDRCHVKEVEEAASNVLSDSNVLPMVSPEDVCVQPSEITNPIDYYNEEETLEEEIVEKVLYDMKPEKIKEDDYDSPDSESEHSMTPKIDSDSKSPHNQGHTSPQGGIIEPIPKELSPSSITIVESNSQLESEGMSSPCIESVCPNKPTNCAQISVSEDTTLIMPPPLHPAPLSISRTNQVKPIYSRNTDSPVTSSIYVGYHSESVKSPSYSTSASHGQNNILNTPLGSLMPPEYVNVDIKQLFPSYDPGKTPLWGRLFKLPHQLGIYREFIEHYDYMEEVLSQRPSRGDRLHLLYDGILDLGEIPLPEDINYHDEVVELNTPPIPGLDYLAGSEHSWWRRAFKNALDELMNPKNTGSYEQDDSIYKKNSSTQKQHLDSDEINKNNDLNGTPNNDIDTYLGWRLGPAKYWYDQLGLPLDINISEWTEWRRPLTSANSSVCNTSNSYNSSAAQLNSTANVEHEEHNNKNTTNNFNTNRSVSESLPENFTRSTIKQEYIDNESINSGNLDQTCSKQDPDDYQQRLSSNESLIHSSPNPRKNNSRPSCPEEIVHIPDHFFLYQLINWEDDIIYDPQLSANKISTNSRLNAAYAGWIPSQHCRTMASFQDAYQGKFPFILSSKIINGLATSSSSTTGMIMESLLNNHSSKHVTLHSNHPPYSIFPIENEGILKNTWVHDIIYDSDLPVDQQPPPFLLTLDQNDETCILEPIDDSTIETVLSSIRNQRHRRLMNNRGFETESNTPATGATASMGDYVNSLSTVGSNLRGGTTSTIHDNNWSSSTTLNETDSSLPHSKSNTTGSINRTSLQVNFGLASTRGMFTGALAKAEKGAEKVKMILGKHGLLAEDDWQSCQTEKPMNPENKNDLLQDTNEFNSDGSTLASAAAAASGIPPKDSLNLSNDEYYAIRSGALALAGGLARCGPLQHSTPAVELWPPFFPTFMSPLRLRQFHRVPLKRYLRGPMSQYNLPFPVTNLTRHIHRKMREREDERAATGGGEIFFMRTPSDLSGADGEIVLFEFSEEYPPLLAQIGMATRIINYYRPLVPRDRSLSPSPHAYSEPPELPYGSLVYVGGSDSPFLGVIRPGGCLQTVENSMYRAPIYPHTVANTDFLLIRNRNGISIRRVPNAFTVGQEVPLMEVPGPNSKRANNFVRDFLQVFILRLFLRSTDEPKRIKMEEIRKAFPNHSESSVRKRLKVCADFKRTGSDASWWVLRSDYRLPSEEEVRYLVSPEDCCAHYSMLAAELRLKDAGYGEKYIFVLDENQVEEEEDKEGQPKMEDEVRAAPWNTTRAYLASQRGGCFLELHGVADPTGCGEAFSYSKTSAKPGALFRQAGGEVARGLLKGKRTVTGTDADLRKLHLRDARALLRSFGISEADLKTFKRWEIIDMVRFTSTERAKQGEEEGSAKFARGNRLSISEQIRCYKEECQRIFDLQNRVLSNSELLSSDEEVSSEDDEDEVTGTDGQRSTLLGSHGSSAASNSIGGVRLSSLSSTARSYTHVNRNIESVNQMNSKDLEDKNNEKDRPNLKRALENGDQLSGTKRPRKTNQLQLKENSLLTGLECNEPGSLSCSSNTSTMVYDASATAAGAILDLTPPWPNANKKMLRIMRTYSEDGHQYTRTELVPWSPVVEIYLKIRQTRDDDFIHNFVDSDNHFREQQRKEKRRLQDQLRRLRKQQQVMRERGGATGGGGGIPGMKSLGLSNKVNRHRRHKTLTEALIKMRCGACGQTGHMRTNKECPMYGRSINTSSLHNEGIRRTSAERAQLRTQTVIRNMSRSGDLNATELINSKSDEPDAIAAAQALASRPVCELLAEQEEEDKANFANDLDNTENRNLSKDLDDDESSMHGTLGENDMTVEGTKLKLHSGLTKYIKEQNRRNLKLKIRRQLLDRLDAAAAVVQSANSNRRGLMGTTGGRGGGRNRRNSLSMNDDDFPTSIKHRGNRRRIDPRVALNHIFEGIYKGLTQIPGYKIFMHPVKEKDFPNYYSQIETPMDLSQIRMKINENSYATREEFLSDIRLIYNNSSKFNGRYSAYTETAMKMCSHVMEQFCHKELKLMRLESLVNPLLDEDDLVGLSYLLQQAIEAMRGVEHSRPFHIPVDKRRYPDYYKIISNPMDLSTLEKLVKENRFRSRDEFFVQIELILSNCVTFNGSESPLTVIAQKMLQAARTRLEQDKETLDSIEANIRTQLESESYAELISSQVDASADSHSSHILENQTPKSTLAKSLPSKRRINQVSKLLKRKSIKSTLSKNKELNNKKKKRTKSQRLGTIVDNESLHGTSSDGQTTYHPMNKPLDITSTSNCGRSLRQRASGAWYGVDLEYDDDEDDGNESGNDDIAKDANDNHLISRPSTSKQDISMSKQWPVDDESSDVYASKSGMSLRIDASLSKGQYSDHTEDSSYMGHNTVTHDEHSFDWNNQIHSTNDQVRQIVSNLSEPSSPTSERTTIGDENLQNYSYINHNNNNNDDDDDDEDYGVDYDMGNSLNSSRELNSDGNSRQIGDWNQSASMTNIDDGVEDENYGNDDDDDDDFIESRSQQDKCPTYIDEETRFSIGTSEIPISITDRPSHLDYSQSNLNDDLVAKDLQLTDSDDDDSCLSGQGGELCADSDTAIIPYNINEDEQETALNDAPQCTEYNPNDSEIVSHSFSTYEQQHRRQNDQDNINNDRPTFFISDDDD
ncbi:Transcription initiation factor TFIID subunit 1-like [Schistosoma japonicum]|nr:Transcription initiation factor TFIID subunit 1-like [Schistosoma japonicum]